MPSARPEVARGSRVIEGCERDASPWSSTRSATIEMPGEPRSDAQRPLRPTALRVATASAERADPVVPDVTPRTTTTGGTSEGRVSVARHDRQSDGRWLRHPPPTCRRTSSRPFRRRMLPPSVDPSVGEHQLRVQQRSARRAADRVVPHRHELGAEDRRTTGRTRPTVTVIPPPLPSRRASAAGRFGHPHDRSAPWTRSGRSEILRLARERPQRSADCHRGRPGVEADRQRRRVPIDNRHTRRLSAQDHAMGRDRIVCVSAEDLHWVSRLDLLLLAAGDRRNDVAEDVERR